MASLASLSEPISPWCWPTAHIGSHSTRTIYALFSLLRVHCVWFQVLALRAAADVGLPPPRCLVLLEPDVPGYLAQPEVASLLTAAAPLQIPTLIVGALGGEGGRGSADALAPHFTDATLLEHAEDHRPLPANREAVAVLVQHIRDFTRTHLSRTSG
jgi:hypothetical protein